MQTKLTHTLRLLSGALFLLSVSDPLLSEAADFLWPVLTLLEIIVPYCLWLFARAVFEAPWPRWWILAGFGLLAVCVWAIFIGSDSYGHTEHQLRKLINGRLGFRNFSAFLNSHRIPEAKKVLADAGQVRKPVLTIAPSRPQPT